MSKTDKDIPLSRIWSNMTTFQFLLQTRPVSLKTSRFEPEPSSPQA